MQFNFKNIKWSLFLWGISFGMSTGYYVRRHDNDDDDVNKEEIVHISIPQNHISERAPKTYKCIMS